MTSTRREQARRIGEELWREIRHVIAPETMSEHELIAAFGRDEANAPEPELSIWIADASEKRRDEL